MTSTCSEHNRLMNDLALGRLDDDSAQRAQTIQRSCPACSQWWQSEILSHAQAIDPAVAEVFADFQAPSKRRLSAWQPLAAAAVLALAVGLVLKPADPSLVGHDQQAGDNTVIHESFEIESLDDIDLSGLSLTVVETKVEADRIFDATQESGDLTGWSSHS